MSQTLKNWWRARHTKHYLKSHWHLFADIFLLVVILGLGATLIILHYYPSPIVNLTPIEHIGKENLATTTPGSLALKSSILKKNIYSGQAFTIKLNLENKGSNNISALEITPSFTNESFSIGKLENTNASSSVKIKGHKLILENLLAGESEEAEILVTINAESNSPRSVSWVFYATYQEVNKTYTSDYALSDLKLVTDLKVKAEAYYNSPQGDQLGSGPIPPILGFPTNYWVFFEVDNVGNDLKGLTVSAKLPEGVTLSNRKTLSAGEFTYNEGQKRLTWLVKEVSVKDGLYQLGFEVQLLPLEKQLGSNPYLINSISYLATDAYTGEKLSGNLLSLDTQLPLDTMNRGQGVVTK